MKYYFRCSNSNFKISSELLTIINNKRWNLYCYFIQYQYDQQRYIADGNTNILVALWSNYGFYFPVFRMFVGK